MTCKANPWNFLLLTLPFFSPFFLAPGAPPPSVHLLTAPIHRRASHGRTLHRSVQQDSHAGDHEQLPRAGTPLVSGYRRLHQTGGCH